MNRKHLPNLAAMAVLLVGSVSAAPLGTAFTYQGRLSDGGQPAQGVFDFRFSVFDAPSDGAPVGPILSSTVMVSNGLFSTTLDFGPGLFGGDARWLQLAVASNGSGFWNLLTPRQPLTPAPYALYAPTAGTAGSANTALSVALLSVTGAGIANGTLTEDKLASGQVVKSLNGLKDAVTLSAGSNILITPQGQTLQIAATVAAGPPGSVGPAGPAGPAGPSTTISNSFYIGSDSDGNEANSTLTLGTDNQAILTLRQGGNVGLGTNAPQQKLHINGSYALVEGAGHEQVYLGSDGAGHDVQMGSFQSVVTNIGFYNQARLEYMNIYARDVRANGTVTAAAFSGSGSSLSALNASALASGTVADGRLSANVALRSGGNTFTGDQIISSGDLGIGTTSPESKLDVRGVTTIQIAASGNNDNLVLKKTGVLSASNAEFVWSHRGGGTALWLYGYDGSHGYRNLQGWDYGNNTVRFPADGQTLFVNQGQDRVGVGTASPQQQLHVVGNARVEGSGTGTANPALYVTNASNGIGIFSTTASSDANVVVVNKAAGDILKGFSGATGGNLVFRVSNAGYTYCADELSCKSLDIRGGADLAEPFAMSGESIRPGAVVVIDEHRPGQLRLSTRAYDSAVAGVVSGAGGVAPGIRMIQENTLPGGQNVALSGRVFAWVDASVFPVKPGDLLTTSDRPGHAMKAADAVRAPGTILGKAMTRLEAGQGLVLVLVSLQ
ncbi:MAG: hypothetical protein HZA90_14780 [Verrucomicrobia bacterium]|nr:hypothetical protein [Verrucomicrobiota bacterium]